MTKQERDPPVFSVVDLTLLTPGLFPTLKYFWCKVSIFFLFLVNSIQLHGPRRAQSEVWDPATLRSLNMNMFYEIQLLRTSWWVSPRGLYLDNSGWLHSLPYSHATLSQYIRWSLTRFFGWVLLDNVDGEHPFTSENFLNLCEQVTVIDMVQHWAYTIMCCIISHFVLQHSKWIHVISIWIWSVHWFGRYTETLSFVFVICQIQLLFSAMLLRNHIKWVMEMLRSTEWEHFEKGNVRHIVRQSWKKVVNLLISRFTDN